MQPIWDLMNDEGLCHIKFTAEEFRLLNRIFDLLREAERSSTENASPEDSEEITIEAF